MFFNGFTLLMMIVGGGVGFWISRLTMNTEYLVKALSQIRGHEYDSDGQVVIYTGLYESAEAQ